MTYVKEYIEGLKWFDNLKKKDYKTLKTLKHSEINYFRKLLSDYYDENGWESYPWFFDYLKDAIECEIGPEEDELFYYASDNYKNVYGELEKILTGYKLDEAKKVLKKKISQMKYGYGKYYYSKKNYYLFTLHMERGNQNG